MPTKRAAPRTGSSGPLRYAWKPLIGPASMIPVSWPATAWSTPRRGLLARPRGQGRGRGSPGL